MSIPVFSSKTWENTEAVAEVAREPLVGTG